MFVFSLAIPFPLCRRASVRAHPIVPRGERELFDEGKVVLRGTYGEVEVRVRVFWRVSGREVSVRREGSKGCGATKQCEVKVSLVVRAV